MDCLFLQESKLNQLTPKNIKGYTSFHFAKNWSGGLITYVKKDLEVQYKATTTNNIETMVIVLNKEYTLINTYNDHQSPLEINEIKDLLNTGNKVAIIGDLNSIHTGIV